MTDLPAPTPQPYLHERVTCLRAPTVVLSRPDGQLADGADGVFQHDRRVLSRLRVTVDDQAPTPVSQQSLGAGAARFVAVVRHLGDPIADPTVRLERDRRIDGERLLETVTLVNNSRREIAAKVAVELATDFASMDAVKHGEPAAPLRPGTTDRDRMEWVGDSGRTIVGASRPAEPVADPEPAEPVADPEPAVWRWRVRVPAGESWAVTLTVSTEGGAGAHTFRAAAPGWGDPAVSGGPPPLAPLLRQGLADLTALTVADPQHPAEVFAAAGSPWYLTLFGRDSLWAARFLLPFGTGLARGTLHALARRQGRRHDPATAEAPGKIPHEVRSLPPRAVGGHPVYYGTVDATALWICLLHDAWRWGLPAGQVAELLDPLEAALRWLTDESDPDGDGFLEYLDVTGEGLANQGWKDSEDAIQFADGRIAAAPIVLSEAQAYAYEAAQAGAALLAGFDRPGADRLLAWAHRLRDRFRAAFWVADGRGRFPALALDAEKRPVAVPASNLGHLLGTGLLTQAEESEVAARLAAPDLDCGYGLRTLSGEAAGFNPLGYHTGSVWPHDTAIAVLGLARAGHPQPAAALAAGLLRAAPAFDHRLPELFGGVAAAGGPVWAYPASCRPQAWSAASVAVLVQAALGLTADVPAGTVTVAPRPEFADWFPMRVDGVQVAGHPLEIMADGSGQVTVNTAAPLTVRTEPSSLPAPRVPVSRSEPAPERTG
ncbi:amylo-alpha-1,6-glucosidase [Natronosporangium hydrolyticum]|uniref:Amylo-alpha-1,6-glucosidase n=1 Tax=Natronosporangium hydrolyticum TaxID=2811111 RepID=A0A895YJB5_9ACTN|nr:glycogen debranching N-terminal domain-containing protein [Natronosporangium hydrolyticum]QSB15453.1 amylo-alpha-1,6-glucosidase [Natronosporangium hydrolyticum]